MMWKFDPPQPLTLEEITQLFRDSFKNLTDEAKNEVIQAAPVIGQYLVEQPE